MLTRKISSNALDRVNILIQYIESFELSYRISKLVAFKQQSVD